jgi:hypothetical protein
MQEGDARIFKKLHDDARGCKNARDARCNARNVRKKKSANLCMHMSNAR